MRTDKRPDSLRIAIVGCGRMGLQHARSASQLGHRIRVACDVDGARASAVASEHPGCEVVTDAATIDWDEVDAGFVCTPPFARGPVELFAAQAGVPLFLEKPIGLSATQCLSALTAFRLTGTITSVGYMNRYRASIRRARSLLEGETVLGFAAHWVCAAYRVPWWGDPALSGGQLNEQCTHLIDLARHLIGEVSEIHAFAQPNPLGRGAAAVSMALRFRNGALGTGIGGQLIWGGAVRNELRLQPMAWDAVSLVCDSRVRYQVRLCESLLEPGSALVDAIGDRRALLVTTPTVDRLYGPAIRAVLQNT